MATLRLDINVTSNAAQTITAVTGNLASLTGAITEANTAGLALGGTAGNLVGGLRNLAATIGLFKGIRFLFGLVQEGIEFNAMMDTSRIGIAAMIDAFANFYKGTVQITDATEKWNIAQGIAQEIQDGLRVAALKTTLQYSELLRVLQTGISYLLQAGITAPKQIVDFVQTFSQAAKSATLNIQEIGTNIRGLLTGVADPRRARFAYQILAELGGTLAERRATIAHLVKTGELFDVLMAKMAPFKRAGEDLALTFTGALSNLKDAVEQALGAGTSQATRDLTHLILDLRNKIVQFDEAGHATFNPDFVNRVKTLADAFVTLAGAISKFIEAGIKYDPHKFEYNPAQALGEGIGTWQRNLVVNAFKGRGSAVAAQFGFNPQGQYNTMGERRMTEQQGEEAWLAATDQARYEKEIALQQQRINAAVTLKAKADQYGAELEKQAEKQRKINEWVREQVELHRQNAAVLLLEADAHSQINKFQENELAAEADIAKKSSDLNKELRKDLERKDLSAQQRSEIFDAQVVDLEAYKKMRLAKLEETQNIERNKEIASAKKSMADKIKLDQEEAVKHLHALDEELLEEMKIRGRYVAAQKQLIDETAASLAYAVEGGLVDLFSGRGIRNAINGLVADLRASLAKFFTTDIKMWIEQWRNIAQGQPYRNSEGKLVNPSERMQAIASGGMAAVQGASWLYGTYQTAQTSSRGTAMVSGAAQGAAMGMQFGPYAAVAGALVGAAAGAVFSAIAAGAKARFQVTVGSDGKMSVKGFGGASQSDVDAAVAQLNATLSGLKQQAQDIIAAFPTAIANALRGEDTPSVLQPGIIGDAVRKVRTFIISIRKKSFAGGFTADELKHFNEVELPQMIFDAYAPLFQAGLSELGVTSEKIAQLFEKGPGFDPKAALESIKAYIEVVAGLKEMVDFLAKSMPDKMAFAATEAGKSPFDKMVDLTKQIQDLSIGFGELGSEEQITRGRQILDLVRQRYQIELAYLAQINQLLKDIPESTTKLIESLQMGEMSPDERIGFLRGKIAGGMTGLAGAKTPDEVQRAVADIQGWAQQLYSEMRNRYNEEIQMVQNIKNIIKDVNASIQAQLDQIQMDQFRLGYDENGNPIYDKKRQSDFLLGQQRNLFDQLAQATDPTEVQRLTQQIQANATALYDLWGKTPEAAAQVTAQLQEAQRIANEALARMQKEHEDAAKNYAQALQEVSDLLTKTAEIATAQLQVILKQIEENDNALNTGLGDIFKTLTTVAGDSATSLDGLATAADGASEALRRLSGAVPGAGGPPVPVQPPDVQVHLYGSTAAVVSDVMVQAAPAIETRVVQGMAQSQRRRRAL